MKNLIKVILTQTLVILGFSACDRPIAPEYGVPHIEFQAKGTVTTEEKAPLEGIQVIVKTDSYEEGNDTSYTDANGNFSSKKYEYLFSITELESIEFNDIDSTANGGEFESREIQTEEIEMEKTTEGESWFRGGYEATVDVELKKNK